HPKRFTKHLAVENGLQRQTVRNATIRRPIRRFSAKCFQRFPAKSQKYRGHFFGCRNVSPMRRLVGGPKGTRTIYQMIFLSLGNVVRKPAPQQCETKQCSLKGEPANAWLGDARKTMMRSSE